VTDEIMDMIHSMEDDTNLLQEYMEESLLTHLPILTGMKVSMTDYVSAIKYCNLKQNMTNEKAWAIVFPERYDKLVREDRYNVSHSSMYNATALVSKINAQMMIASHIQYAPYYHEAIKKQYDLMNGRGADIDDRVSAHVQHLSAKTLAELTAPPIESQLNIKIEQSDGAKSAQEKMFEQMNSLAQKQQLLLEQGHNITDIQKLNLKIELVDEDDGEAEYAELIGEENG